MLTSFPCPVCDGSTWKPIETFRYGRSDALPGSRGHYRDYVLLRRRVLFEVWFPDAETITLRSLMCCGCGFMTYAPRPSEADLEAKYRFLQATEKDIGGQSSSPKVRLADRRRAISVYTAIARYVARERISVLDFGGGNGKLLAPFLERGHCCALVDYTLKPLPGIQKIGETLHDVPPEQTFDAIICSHVLEHLAQPAQLLHRLSNHLSEDGVMYAEVPAEIWKGIGIERDPVTHVNFFTFSSFHELFARQGLDVLEGMQGVGTYGGGRIDVLVVIARKGGARVRPMSHAGVRETERLLNPSCWMELHRRSRLRKLPTVAGLLRRLRSTMAQR
jgi:SAM-dependent methyltransferase